MGQEEKVIPIAQKAAKISIQIQLVLFHSAAGLQAAVGEELANKARVVRGGPAAEIFGEGGDRREMIRNFKQSGMIFQDSVWQS